MRKVFSFAIAISFCLFNFYVPIVNAQSLQEQYERSNKEKIKQKNSEDAKLKSFDNFLYESIWYVCAIDLNPNLIKMSFLIFHQNKVWYNFGVEQGVNFKQEKFETGVLKRKMPDNLWRLNEFSKLSSSYQKNGNNLDWSNNRHKFSFDSAAGFLYLKDLHMAPYIKDEYLPIDKIECSLFKKSNDLDTFRPSRGDVITKANKIKTPPELSKEEQEERQRIRDQYMGIVR